MWYGEITLGQDLGKSSVTKVQGLYGAAERGDSDAQFGLGQCYAQGDGVVKDPEKAVMWHRKAALQGHVEAQFNLAGLLFIGSGNSETREAEAKKWAQLAAKQGHAEAQFLLGLLWDPLLDLGEGKGKDPNKALKWYRSAAELGLAKAQFEMGRCYLGDRGLEANDAEAVSWFRKAAEQGNSDGQQALAFSYMRGSGVEKDYGEAVTWLRKLATKNRFFAMYHIGQLYSEGGNGLVKDLTKAAKWFLEGAEWGYSPAQVRLSFCYRHGDGVLRDYVRAYKWANLAAVSGDEDAKKSREELELKMTAEQISEGQQLSRDWKSRSTR